MLFVYVYFSFLPKMVRCKNRYIVAQIVPEQDISGSLEINEYAISKSIMKNVEKYYGDFGVGSVEHSFRIKYCNPRTRIAIIRCRHRPHRFVTSILPLITTIATHRAKFRILYTGATIMQCNKFIVKHQQDFLDKAVGKIKSAKARQDFIKNVLDIRTE